MLNNENEDGRAARLKTPQNMSQNVLEYEIGFNQIMQDFSMMLA